MIHDTIAAGIQLPSSPFRLAITLAALWKISRLRQDGFHMPNDQLPQATLDIWNEYIENPSQIHALTTVLHMTHSFLFVFGEYANFDPAIVATICRLFDPMLEIKIDRDNIALPYWKYRLRGKNHNETLSLLRHG